MQLQPSIDYTPPSMPTRDLKIRASVKPGSEHGKFVGVIELDGEPIYQTADLSNPEYASHTAAEEFARRLGEVLSR